MRIISYSDTKWKKGISLLLVFFFSFFLAGCLDSLDRGPVQSVDPGTDIDAAASASKELKIMGGIIKAREVSVDIWFKYDNGETNIALQEGDTNNVDWGLPESLNNKPNYFVKNCVNRYTFRNLKPATTYSVKIEGNSLENKYWIVQRTFVTKSAYSSGNR